VRDLLSGAVLFIGTGQGGDALQAFRKRIGRKAKQIKAVRIDMSNAYSAWVAEVLPHLEIIHDHCHVIKLMNERMDNLRRSTMNKLAEEQKKEVSGIHCLKQMAKTIRTRIEGLLVFWRHHRLTNASQEGFNNKIGWLTKQAYGYRGEDSLHLKIYDLPNRSTRKEL
jgi:transposase